MVGFFIETQRSRGRGDEPMRGRPLGGEEVMRMIPTYLLSYLTVTYLPIVFYQCDHGVWCVDVLCVGFCLVPGAMAMPSIALPNVI